MRGLATCGRTGPSEGGAASGSGVPALPGARSPHLRDRLGASGPPARRLLLSDGDMAPVAQLWSMGTTAPSSSGSGRRLPRSSGHESFLSRNSVSSSKPEAYLTQPCLPRPAFKQILEGFDLLSCQRRWPQKALPSARPLHPKSCLPQHKRAARRTKYSNVGPHINPGLFPCILGRRLPHPQLW